MKNTFFIGISIFSLVIATLACSVPSAESTAAPIPPTPPPSPFVGMWMSETETLVFTEKNLYRVESNAGTTQTTEQFAVIIAHDAINKRISLETQWMKVNAIAVGFDSIIYSLSYKIEGDVLQIGLGTANEFTSELSPTIYYRK